MTDQDQGSPMITNAVVWATLMIATALVLADVGDKQKSMVLLLQIAGWFSVNLALTKGGNSLKSEWACLSKHFGKNDQE